MKVGWNDAEDSCLEYDAQLISIHNNITNQLILNAAKKVYDQYIWLGLNSLDKIGSYKWSDGTPRNYDNFTKLSANTTEKPLKLMNKCVAFDTKNGEWVYHSCNEKLGYYCQKTYFPVITTSILLG